jgi:hypothetical protein
VPRSSIRARLSLGAVLLAMFGVMVSGCAGPTTTDGGYRAKTAGALQDISTALATATLTMQLERNGRMTLALTETSISQAESDASSAQSSWATRQPPTAAALRLHDRVQQPMQDGVSALTELRIAYRNDDQAGIAKALAEMNRASKEIDQAIQEASG